MKRFLLVAMNCLLATFTMGQGYIGPSPNATAVMRQVNVGVSHYTGTPNISIPLAGISGRELGVSASLIYNPGGNKVQDIASSEGLGWTLSAGGMITRVVRGEPDDKTGGFCRPNPTDTEPDIFIFSFMGRSGKFVLNGNGTPVLFPYQDLKIITGICGSGTTWEIIDESGTRYQFGATTSSREETSSKKIVGNDPAINYTSTWHLSKVISMNGTDDLDFSYVSSNIKYQNYLYGQDDGCTTDSGLKNESTELTIGSKYLSSIRSSGGYIYFTWNNGRDDITGGKSLAEIRVNNNAGNQVKKIRFKYSYFQGCATQLCKRLKLDAIYDLSPEPIYSFVYNTNDNLPSRDSKSFDHWGYYNGYTGTSWIPADPVTGYPGASRDPHITRMQANLLVRVNQRNGGFQHFYYEPHLDVRDSQNNSNLVSGVRINNIQTGDGLGNIFTTYYKYFLAGSPSQSSGLLFRKPKYAFHYIDNNNLIVMRRYSHAYSELWDVNGSHVGYSRVEESVTGKGKTIYEFTNYDSNPDEALGGIEEHDSPPYISYSSKFWERGNPSVIKVEDELGRQLFKEIYEYTYNHIIKSEVAGNKSMSVHYSNCYGSSGSYGVSASYKIVSRPFTLLKKTTEQYDQEDPANTQKITHTEEYNYDPVTNQLVKSTRWNTAVPAEKQETVNKYITHQDYNYSQAQACVDSYNQCLQSCGEVTGPCADNCYSNYSNCLSQSISDERVKAILSLRGKHAHNTVVEQQNWVNRNGTRTLLGASLNLFKLVGSNNNLIVPASAWASKKVSGAYTGSSINSSGTFIQPASFLLSGSIDTYDNTYARPLQKTDRDGTVTQYTWLHNQTVQGTITTNPGNEEIAKSYLYTPLVGVTKETDTNNRSVNTEFDHLGRVRVVKDHEGIIRERFRYHYKNETPNVVIRSNRSQAITGQSTNFTLEDMVLPTGGTPEIAWDMDNGTVYDDSRQSVSLSYSNAGLYTVKTVMFTNEFEPYTATLDMLVSNPLNISLCADGPQRVDLSYQAPVIYGSCTTGNNQPTSPTVFHANFSTLVSTGCIGMYNYKWEFKNSTASTWITINSLVSTAPFPPQYQTGTYQIRCTVTDGCGNTVTASSYVELYKSNSLC